MLSIAVSGCDLPLNSAWHSAASAPPLPPLAHRREREREREEREGEGPFKVKEIKGETDKGTWRKNIYI